MMKPPLARKLCLASMAYQLEVEREREEWIKQQFNKGR